MSERKALIRRLIENGVRLSFDPTPWSGPMFVSTRRTVYRLQDGVCVAVHRQDTESSRSDFVGMQLIGWIVDENATPILSRTWRPGASALFLRPGEFVESIAITSATIQLRHEAPFKSSHLVRRNAPPSYAIARDSMTRIGLRGRSRP